MDNEYNKKVRFAINDTKIPVSNDDSKIVDIVEIDPEILDMAQRYPVLTHSKATLSTPADKSNKKWLILLIIIVLIIILFIMYRRYKN